MPTKARNHAVKIVERAMVAIRRSQTKRALSRLLDRASGSQIEISHSFVVDALDQPDKSAPTVGEVAVRLGADASRTSRMVASAVKAGYVRRVASQHDGRSVGLELTDAGRALAETARQVRTAAFDRTMQDWSDEECETFARLLSRFIGTHQRLAEIRSERHDTPST